MANVGAAQQTSDAVTALAGLRAQLIELVFELRAVDIRSFEGLELDEQVHRVHPLATDLLARGVALVSGMLGASAPTSHDTLPPGLPFELTMDAAVEQTPSGSTELGDIAFCALLELQQRQQRLRVVVVSSDPTTLLMECDSALRRLYKALCALKIALSHLAGSEPQLDFTPELERSLRVRRYYALLRSKIAERGEPTPDTLHARLRAVGTTIAVLVGQDVYGELRVGDRMQIRSLQRRLLRWLRTHTESGAEAAGLELWRDVKAFVEMLREVNRRQELVEHDSLVVRDALAYAATTERDTFPPELRPRLAALAGLDPDVDLVLDEDHGWQIDRFRRVLGALAGSGGHSRGGT